ncbi:hypothetical protein OG429_37690 [Streptomyces sp. NBC_00190]|uniref:hypothetical protein n=1 Tax=unclassified Streptomyces TaxID=2593676 RepID=UPI002E2ADF34|nr:hypothetical protein [Streptomyces sp. NBC_00190]WSZ44500.1 hypothetical protein OG239_40165 [Streptomyces sp. NBC_00868]
MRGRAERGVEVEAPQLGQEVLGSGARTQPGGGREAVRGVRQEAARASSSAQSGSNSASPR